MTKSYSITADTMSQHLEPVSAHARTYVSDVEVVASYTWLNKPTPTIAVPGSPAKWTLRTDRKDIGPDPNDKVRVLDYNRHRYPVYPMAPAIYAVLELKPDYDFSKDDIITDKQPLALLLKLPSMSEEGQAQAEPNPLDKFYARIFGNSVVLARNDDKITAMPNANLKSYRDGWEKEYLTPPATIKRGQSHFAITTYRLSPYQSDGLNIMIRHSVDAMAPKCDIKPITQAHKDEKRHSRLTIQSAGLSQPGDHVELNTYKSKTNSSISDKRRREKQREAWLTQAGHSVGAWYEESFDREQRCWSANFPRDRVDDGCFEPPSRKVAGKFQMLLEDVIGKVRKECSVSGGESRVFGVQLDFEEGGVVVESTKMGSLLPRELVEMVGEGKDW